MADKYSKKFVFPKTMNLLLPLLVLAAVGGATYVPVVAGIGMSPENTDVGYQPEQPVPYSHALHVGQLGLDCRYCHTTVDQAAFAAIPPVQTCMNCHTNVKKESPKLQPVRDAWTTGKPMNWVTVHDLPDFAFFNHSAHVNKGVSCVECHGRIDHMGEEGVFQAKNLSMGWCLDCHRSTEKVLRPRDQVTNLGWKVEDLATAPKGSESFEIHEALLKHKAEHPEEPKEITQLDLGKYLQSKYKIRDHQYLTACSTCHR
ncbi:MAG: cytochrome c3 family protein [Tepidisphaeraceae bacterium]